MQPVVEKFHFPEGRAAIAQIPGNPDLNPLVIVPSWSATLENQRQILTSLHTQTDQSLLAFELERINNPARPSYNKAPYALARYSEVLAEIIDGVSNHTRVDIMAQSMGAATLLIACRLYPELADKIGEVVLISPAGLFPKKSKAELYWRFAHHSVQNAWEMRRHPESRGHMTRHSLVSITNNLRNLRQVFTEANALAFIDEYETLRNISDAGIRVGVVQFKRDLIFPYREFIGRFTSEYPNPPYDTLLTAKGTHHPSTERDHDEYARIILEMFSKLKTEIPERREAFKLAA